MIPRPEKNAQGLLTALGRLNRERRGRSLRLPAWSVQRMEAEGSVNGLRYSQMPGSNGVSKACNWWLWKRGLLVLDDERAEAQAMADFDKGGEA